MKDLLTIVVPRVAHEWETLAHYMDFEISGINIIKNKCRDDPEKCCGELLERWFQHRYKCDKTWEKLLTILKRIRKLAAVTEKIEKEVSDLQLYVIIIIS